MKTTAIVTTPRREKAWLKTVLDDAKRASVDRKQLIAEIARLRTALEYYANNTGPIVGEVARKALWTNNTD